MRISDWISDVCSSDRDAGLDAIPENLRPYRYLLSPTLDGQPLDADYPAAQLDERLQALGPPAGALVEPLIGSDPTLAQLTVAGARQPASPPRRRPELWFECPHKDRERAG